MTTDLTASEAVYDMQTDLIALARRLPADDRLPDLWNDAYDAIVALRHRLEEMNNVA